MKKDSFLKGAMIATICIVFSKILGIVYVIPFHAILNENGRNLYGYAYTWYVTFLNISTLGIPLAVSKLVSEYHSLGYERSKNKTYRLSLIIISAISIVSTLVFILLAPTIAEVIMKQHTDGSSIADITYVLRMSSCAILFVSILSCLRGYLQGHKYMTSSSISQVVEQLVRIIVVLGGSYIGIKLFGIKEAVGIAVFGATVGAVSALIYLYRKSKGLNKSIDISAKKEEKNITDKVIVKKLIKYSIPFVFASIVVSIFNNIDQLTILDLLIKLGGLTTNQAEGIINVITTWGAKLNSIVTAVSSGILMAILPNLTSDFVKNDMKEVQNKVNHTMLLVTFFVVPMVFGLSFLAEPVWNLFYETNSLNINVFRFSICTALFYSLFLNVQTIMQSLNRIKISNISLAIAFFIKLLLNIPMFYLFDKLNDIPLFGNLPVYYASIFTTILAYIVIIIICFIDLKKHLNINFSNYFKNMIYILFSSIVMIVVLRVLLLFVPLTGNTFYSILVVALYASVGASVYFVLNNIFGVFENVFECSIKDLFKKITRRIK